MGGDDPRPVSGAGGSAGGTGGRRDADGRLVWGVNDFDEAAEMPYPLDLVRLATSAVLGSPGAEATDDICMQLLEGYARGLADPHAIVLDQDYAWLRQLVVVSDKERADFWHKMETLAAGGKPPPNYVKALAAAMPERGNQDGRPTPHGGSRKPGASALGRDRPMARRPDCARSQGDGALGLDPRQPPRPRRAAMASARHRTLPLARPLARAERQHRDPPVASPIGARRSRMISASASAIGCPRRWSGRRISSAGIAGRGGSSGQWSAVRHQSRVRLFPLPKTDY
jgi:hypothetical protein